MRGFFSLCDRWVNVLPYRCTKWTRGATGSRWGTLKSCSNYTFKGYHFGWYQWNETETICSSANSNVRWTWVRDTLCLLGGEDIWFTVSPPRYSYLVGPNGSLPFNPEKQGEAGQVKGWKAYNTKKIDNCCEFNYIPSARIPSILKSNEENNFLRYSVFRMVKICPQKNGQSKSGKTENTKEMNINRTANVLFKPPTTH